MALIPKPMLTDECLFHYVERNVIHILAGFTPRFGQSSESRSRKPRGNILEEGKEIDEPPTSIDGFRGRSIGFFGYTNKRIVIGLGVKAVYNR
jgi:hypothetical protein